MKRSRTFAFSDHHRRWLMQIIAGLKLSQKVVADECGISQGWLSQILSGVRKGAEPDQVLKIRDGLIRLLERYTGEDKESLLASVQETLTTQAVIEQYANETAMALRIAADIMETLISKCPTKSMRRQVIEFLRTAVEQ